MEKLDKLLVSYKEQRSKAVTNGVAWEFNFKEWVLLWEQSGKLHNRGTGKNQYVLSRIDSNLSFSADNSIIRTNSENAKDKSYIELKQSSENGKLQQKKKKDNIQFGLICTPFGEFRSVRDAAKNEVPPVNHNTIAKRIKSSNFPDYYKINKEGFIENKEVKSNYNSSVKRIRKVRTPLGIFDNAKLAAEAHEVSASTISRKLNNDSSFNYIVQNKSL